MCVQDILYKVEGSCKQHKTGEIQMDTIKIEGGYARVGMDYVGFKDDVEQYGKLVGVQGGFLKIEVFDGVTGEKHEVLQHPSRCWIE